MKVGELRNRLGLGFDFYLGEAGSRKRGAIGTEGEGSDQGRSVNFRLVCDLLLQAICRWRRELV